MSCSICVAASPWLGVPNFSIRSSCFWDLSFICVVARGSTRKYSLHDSCGSIIAYRAAPKDFIVFSSYIYTTSVSSYHTLTRTLLFSFSQISLHLSTSPLPEIKRRRFLKFSPTFFQKTPTFLQKTPTFFQKSPTFSHRHRSFFKTLSHDLAPL